MAKIRRITTSADELRKSSSTRKPLLSNRLRKFIPFIKPLEPVQEIADAETVVNEQQSVEPAGDENSTQSTTTGSTGSTDPGTTTTASSTSTDMEPMIGEIRMFAGNYAPRGWAFCDGQLLNIADYPALYSLLGTVYGGDGRNNFALPDLRGRVSIHPGQGGGLTDSRLGSSRGDSNMKPCLAINYIISLEGIFPARN